MFFLYVVTLVYSGCESISWPASSSHTPAILALLGMWSQCSYSENGI